MRAGVSSADVGSGDPFAPGVPGERAWLGVSLSNGNPGTSFVGVTVPFWPILSCETAAVMAPGLGMEPTPASLGRVGRSRSRGDRPRLLSGGEAASTTSVGTPGPAAGDESPGDSGVEVFATAAAAAAAVGAVGVAGAEGVACPLPLTAGTGGTGGTSGSTEPSRARFFFDGLWEKTPEIRRLVLDLQVLGYY